MLVGVAHAQEDRSDAERRLQGVRTELKQVAAERRKLEGAARRCQPQAARSRRSKWAACSVRCRRPRRPCSAMARTLQQLQAERSKLAGDMDAKKPSWRACCAPRRFAGSEAPLKAMLAQDRVAEAERALTYQGYLQRGQVQRIRGAVGGTAAHRHAGARDRRAPRCAGPGSPQAGRTTEPLQQAREATRGPARRHRPAIQGSRRPREGAGPRCQGLAGPAGALARRGGEGGARGCREAARAKAEAGRQATPGKPVTRPPARRTTVASAPALRVGGLGWPVAGNLLASFGGRLPDGRRSDGVLIAASAGTAVKAVADGTVVYADWMTGYGNILIIDHGNGYMSLYAHNDGLLARCRRRGQARRQVASVGTSGGQDSPALYFELRRNGSPVNPAGWLTRQ
jgi:septal ring factor EnvC (AmiA/AmiB activator)